MVVEGANWAGHKLGIVGEGYGRPVTYGVAVSDPAYCRPGDIQFFAHLVRLFCRGCEVCLHARHT